MRKTCAYEIRMRRKKVLFTIHFASDKREKREKIKLKFFRISCVRYSRAHTEQLAERLCICVCVCVYAFSALCPFRSLLLRTNTHVAGKQQNVKNGSTRYVYETVCTTRTLYIHVHIYLSHPVYQVLRGGQSVRFETNAKGAVLTRTGEHEWRR